MSNTERSGRRTADGGTQSGRVRRALRSAFASRRAACCLLLTAVCLLSAGCRQDMQDQPRYEYYEPGDKKFFADGASSRQPVEGTVPRQVGDYRDREDYFYTGRAAGPAAGGGGQTMGASAAAPNMATLLGPGAMAGASTDVRGNAAGGIPGAREQAATGGADNFPIDIDDATLRRGRERFQIFCSMCHGMTGEGDGLIVRRGFQRPPSFYDDRLQENVTPASHFFDVISNGWGAMPSYAEMITAEDRWKIIAYLRALQLSRRLRLEDLSPEEQNKVRTGAQPAAPEHGQGGTLLQSPQTGGEKH
ncbi:MAG TPA: cytochrome c [Pyrinomonadaceae bacterium]|jgi:mono/diheme cytochrome c family protein